MGLRCVGWCCLGLRGASECEDVVVVVFIGHYFYYVDWEVGGRRLARKEEGRGPGEPFERIRKEWA